MTGEGDDVKKGPYVFDDQGGMLQSPFLFSGTQVGTPAMAFDVQHDT